MKRPLEKWERKYYHSLEAYIDLPLAIDSVELWWDDSLDTRNGILGYFKIQKPSRIYLQMYNGSIQNDAVYKFWAKKMFSTVAHEMQHMLDYRTHPLMYVAGSAPFLRRYTIEPRAKKIELEVERQIKEMK